ncbi:twin-arginine translocation signal domain-containing protein [Actinoplanes subtropicus]|uniref:twin-arginine translocation signal domain-containing protein n=1 Tax=Actinoplanes subtropicus TaxID=543632 RepID=UPI0004C31787|nr:twin-arginine translocation signal domain-containing protein [Actinoplanes subtropicus]
MTGKPGLSRRDFLGMADGSALATITAGAFALHAGRRENTGRTLTSRAVLPEPFQVPLPVPLVARPVATDGGADRYEIVQRAATAGILPGLRTAVWGYDGQFPARPSSGGPGGRCG